MRASEDNAPNAEPAVAAGSHSRPVTCSAFRCLLVDPPWKMQLPHWRKDKRPGRNPRPPETLSPPYPMMTNQEIANLPVTSMAAETAHLWLWVTNQFLPTGLDLLKVWGFKYHTTVTWVKPSGCGIWFVQRTQHLLFGWRGRFGLRTRCRPNVIETGNPERHSAKPEQSYALIEAVSEGPRLELFARRKRHGWASWGNEIANDVEMPNARTELPRPAK